MSVGPSKGAVDWEWNLLHVLHFRWPREFSIRVRVCLKIGLLALCIYSLCIYLLASPFVTTALT